MTKNPSDYLKFWTILLLFVLIIVYIIFNFRIFIAGPEIIITSPQNGAVVQTELLEIKGFAENISFITLNDRPIFLDEKNNFQEFLLLSSGYNIIVIKAKDKFGREISKKIEVFFNGDSIEHKDIIEIDKSLATSTNIGTSTKNSTSSE